jgi:ribosomal protein L21E
MSKDQLKEERKQILEMLSDGTISADEAEKLLNALTEEKENFQEVIINKPKKGKSFKMLRVLVDSKEGDKVRVQIPVEFAQLLKTAKFNSQVGDLDIDIDAIVEMVVNGVEGEIVNVESSDGDIIKVVVE